MLRFLWKAVLHSFTLHLFVPLLVFVASELTIAYVSHPAGISVEWFWREFIPRLAVVYLTFAVVVALVLGEEAQHGLRT